MYYTNIDHTKRKALKLTLLEYAVYDSIFNISSLAKFTWKINRTYLSDFFDVTRQTIIRTIDKWIRIWILDNTWNCTTSAWQNYIVCSEKAVLENVTECVTKCDSECNILLHNNNIYINNKEKPSKKKKDRLLDLSFEDLVEVWNSVQDREWKKFNSSPSSKLYRDTLSLYMEEISLKYTKDELYSALDNYLKEIGWRKQSNDRGDYFYHRFSLYFFLKQKNWLLKYLFI